MKQRSASAILTSPIAVAFGIAALFSIRFLNCLPFSGSTRVFNYETVATLISQLIFAREPWSFPLGAIRDLTFPFTDANVGNVGALPLFAVGFKALGTLIPYFATFDYFVLVEILSCFLTAYFAQKILELLGVGRPSLRATGGLVSATSFILLTRSESLQPFCVVSFPLFSAWIYGMLLTLRRPAWLPAQDLLVLSMFPMAALLDNYSLFGMLLGTAGLLVRESYEAFFGGLPSSRNRVLRMLFFCAGGVALSLLSLYMIGMYPLPALPNNFTSYDFGMGGRYHGADLLAPWIPVANKVAALPETSLLGRLGFLLTTDDLGRGQYEGVAYVGTPMLLLWIALAIGWLRTRPGSIRSGCAITGLPSARLPIQSPWKKVGIASLLVFIFSLGYELFICGRSFPEFSGMPAAWIADRFPSVYNIRATGRLATLLSIFLILEGIRRLHAWGATPDPDASRRHARPAPWAVTVAVVAICVTHLVEIAPLLHPVPAQVLHPVGGVFSGAEADKLRHLGKGYEAILISPSVRAAEVNWATAAFSLAYHMGLRSNLYYLARSLPEHEAKLTTDLNRITRGDWDPLVSEYGDRVLFAIPLEQAKTLRSKVGSRFQETVVGPVSLWNKRPDATPPNAYPRKDSSK